MIKEDSLISDIKEHFNTLLNARSLAISNDERVLEFLLEKSSFKNEYKERFFQTQYGALIFKKDEFLNFLDLRLLSHSYTSFSNKIGLGASEKKFLKNSQNVVLNFPFKDCVLKGSQSKDDDKSTELFFNNILAKSEIDVLFSPKVLNNFELIGGGQNDTLENVLKNKPNLLIKGNNLIALHTLKEHFHHQSEQNKVKLIYIDPPYNTGSDSFNYNDKFNHSTYLTFIKNRLEIARELLRDDGVIFVQCDISPTDYNENPESAYLNVLLDEIFGRSNYITTIVWKKKGNPSNTEKTIGTITENIFVYAKNKNKLSFALQTFKREYKFKDEQGEYNLEKPLKTNSGSYERKTMLFGVTNPTTNEIIYPPKGQRWTIGENTFKEFLNDNKIVFKDNFVYIKKYENDYINGGQKLYSNLFLEHGSLKLAKSELENLGFDRELFKTPKPEILIKTIIEISTQENDLVMDFFAGSGTTLAVAHKMKRRYIGIEQMEYIESITKERLKKVIEGEQGGISKAVSWSGGGNLIYCELASLNAKFIEKIENSSDENELNQIYENLQKLAFIDYRVDIKNDLKDMEFSNLDFIEKKRILKKCLDRNMDYIPYADIDDREYKIDEQTRILNGIFYKGGNDE